MEIFSPKIGLILKNRIQREGSKTLNWDRDLMNSIVFTVLVVNLITEEYRKGYELFLIGLLFLLLVFLIS